tara:strand:+ start:521495 stop:522334 length:840 start_codon:yes stop_codon:yes gene_type:complete
MTINKLEYFSMLVQQDKGLPLFEAALSIAQDADPDLNLVAFQAEVDTLAEKLNQRLPNDASDMQKLRMLNHYFYNELGFSGNVNDYYHPDNSYLHRVLATRRGIPISLAVLYIELANQIDLKVHGISFPGHFLMKLSIPSGDIVLDPFNGASLSREELEERIEPYILEQDFPDDFQLTAYLATASERDILVRMLHNLKALFMQQKQWQHLLDTQQRLLILLPNDVAELRDRGLAYAHLECPQAALEDLEAYLDQRPYAMDVAEVRAMMPALRIACSRLN